jgi:hypothetical protein
MSSQADLEVEPMNTHVMISVGHTPNHNRYARMYAYVFARRRDKGRFSKAINTIEPGLAQSAILAYPLETTHESDFCSSLEG